jgi:hypothetical protein
MWVVRRGWAVGAAFDVWGRGWLVAEHLMRPLCLCKQGRGPGAQPAAWLTADG